MLFSNRIRVTKNYSSEWQRRKPFTAFIKSFMLKQKTVFTAVLSCLVTMLVAMRLCAQVNDVKLVNVDSGWAANSVNAVVFRKNSLASHKQWEYIAYYNANKFV